MKYKNNNKSLEHLFKERNMDINEDDQDINLEVDLS